MSISLQIKFKSYIYNIIIKDLFIYLLIYFLNDHESPNLTWLQYANDLKRAYSQTTENAAIRESRAGSDEISILPRSLGSIGTSTQIVPILISLVWAEAVESRAIGG